MNPHLFVYGSLMSSVGHPMGERLRREAQLIGAATIRGRLYRISWYPGLVDTDDSDARVHGEVYALSSPTPTLQWLDAYEGIGSGGPDQDAYQRVERAVTPEAGRAITAWVYVYQKSVAGLRPISGGRWVPSPRMRGEG